MKNMGHEGAGEQPISKTPILDSILRKLPPLEVKMTMSMTTDVVEQTKKRLLEKLESGDLTQANIEHELSSLPDVGGMEDWKVNIVDTIRFNCPNYNIKELPVE